jgi:transposase
MMGTADHPMRKLRPLIDTARIRQLSKPLYADLGRPSIPPEYLFLAILGGYLLGVTSKRALVRELTGNLVLRWFVGLNSEQMLWDHSTFSQNRKRRFMESGLLERLLIRLRPMVCYTVTGLMENRHRLLLGINVESSASEPDGGL